MKCSSSLSSDGLRRMFGRPPSLQLLSALAHVYLSTDQVTPDRILQKPLPLSREPAGCQSVMSHSPKKPSPSHLTDTSPWARSLSQKGPGTAVPDSPVLCSLGMGHED